MGYGTGIKKSTAGATSITTTATDFSACNFLAALITWPANVTFTSFVDSKSNTWTPHPSGAKTLTGTNSRGQVYYCANPIVDAAQTFTPTIASSDVLYCAVIGLTGRATVSPLETLTTPYAEDLTAVSSHSAGVTGALADSGVDVLNFFWDDEGTNGGRVLQYTAGSGWTLPAAVSSADGRSMTGGIEYQANVAASTNLTATWTTTTNGVTAASNHGGGFLLAVKAAPIAPTTQLLTMINNQGGF